MRRKNETNKSKFLLGTTAPHTHTHRDGIVYIFCAFALCSPLFVVVSGPFAARNTLRLLAPLNYNIFTLYHTIHVRACAVRQWCALVRLRNAARNAMQSRPETQIARSRLRNQLTIPVDLVVHHQKDMRRARPTRNIIHNMFLVWYGCPFWCFARWSAISSSNTDDERPFA